MPRICSSHSRGADGHERSGCSGNRGRVLVRAPGVRLVTSRDPSDPGSPAPALELTAGAGSFDAFYRAEVDRLYRALAVTLGDHHVAREAVDEAMVRACVRWRTVGGYDRPGGWVYRVGLNWARS